MKKLCLVTALLIAVTAFGQSDFVRPGGQFSLGVRSTTSLFSDESGTGTGFGGQFRIRFFHLLNSEWFADYITSDIGGGLGTRTDYHIGWSVMFYPAFAYRNNERLKLQPYLLAGHCFDYTRFEGNDFAEHNIRSRWSSAVQGGLGFHLPLTDRLDFSLSGQYMMHFGKEIEPHVRTNAAGKDYLYFDEHAVEGLEGHLLVTCSMNIRIADLWQNQSMKPAKKKTEAQQQQL